MTREQLRTWLAGTAAKTRATAEELARMLSVGADEIARILDPAEAAPLDGGTLGKAERLLVQGGRLSTSAEYQWTAPRP